MELSYRHVVGLRGLCDPDLFEMHLVGHGRSRLH